MKEDLRQPDVLRSHYKLLIYPRDFNTFRAPGQQIEAVGVAKSFRGV